MNHPAVLHRRRTVAVLQFRARSADHEEAWGGGGAGGVLALPRMTATARWYACRCFVSHVTTLLSMNYPMNSDRLNAHFLVSHTVLFSWVQY